MLTTLSEETGLARKDVAAVFSCMSDLITRHVQKRGSGEFSIPDCGIKVRRVVKPRTKARMGRNPATGEEIKIPAKPAKTVVKLTALKALKDKIG
ncbi:MAG: HU family DNA-binding protein [Candidatus Thiodiazotropha sp.]